MKTCLKPLLVISLISLLIMSCSKAKTVKKAEWKGEVESKNDTKIVKNPSDPVYGEILFELEKDLSIGREDDDNYLFYNPGNIAVDDQGNISILERGNCRIQKFDKNGKYLQTIGKKGQGPGEFERPYSLLLDKNNNIYVSDRRKIHFFNHTGEFVKTIPLSDQVNDFWVSPEGNIFGLITTRAERERTKIVVKMNSEGKILENIAQFAEVTQVMRKSGNVVQTFSITHSYNPSLYFVFSNDYQIFYGDSSEYSFSRINLDGEVELIVKKEEPLHSISQKEKDKIYEGFSELIKQWPEGVVEEAVQFPVHRPFFDRILIDEKGRIYIKKVKPVLDETENVGFDIFNREGYYLYRTSLPFSPEIIKNGCFYDLFTSDETGEVKIIRYKVLNWDQIKDGF
ncbi:MAG: NHL repeat-containing protein [Candidatus Aminicenantes bacterium]|nr:NHL repeat-containing protein [Candidatus Aminicenantes bacterium]